MLFFRAHVNYIIKLCSRITHKSNCVSIYYKRVKRFRKCSVLKCFIYNMENIDSQKLESVKMIVEFIVTKLFPMLNWRSSSDGNKNVFKGNISNYLTSNDLYLFLTKGYDQIEINWSGFIMFIKLIFFTNHSF